MGAPEGPVNTVFRCQIFTLRKNRSTRNIETDGKITRNRGVSG